MATPRLIQWLWFRLDPTGNRTAITKFVECPVVDNMPRLADVLYLIEWSNIKKTVSSDRIRHGSKTYRIKQNKEQGCIYLTPLKMW